MTPESVKHVAALLDEDVERDDGWAKRVSALREEIEADRRYFEEQLEELDNAEHDLDEAEAEEGGDDA